MKIRAVNSVTGGAVKTLVLAKSRDIDEHPLFKVESGADKAYIKKAFLNLDCSNGKSHVLVLPDGKKLVVMFKSGPKKYAGRICSLAAKQLVSVLRAERITRAVCLADDFAAHKKEDACVLGERIGINLMIANFEFVKYKEKPKGGWSFVSHIDVYSPRDIASLRSGLTRGVILGEESNACRVLANTPGGDMTPALLAGQAVRVARKHGMKIKVLKEKEMSKLKMGGILGVSRGSDAPARFIIMEYMKGKKSEAPYVFVGKGVTFDTGGLNLKPSTGIYEMHLDMSGGAAVIHALAAVSRLKIKKNIVGLIPAVENMPSGSSYRPGDILRTMSGKTIEVVNTDAEGRIILADALVYAKRYKPRVVVDVATLTGAALIALGQRASAVFSSDKKVEQALLRAGEQVQDLVWPMPLWEEFEADIRGTFGDVSNTSKAPYGGLITAAVFLWQFAKNYPWAHIDIAPRMTTIDGEYLAKGASGAGVRLLAKFTEIFE